MNTMPFDTFKSALNSARLPSWLLLFALATVFLFGNDRGHFYRPGLHNWVSAHHLTLALNLSPEHHFLGFVRQGLAEDGIPSYALYNRFPIGGYALLKLPTLPFDNDLSARLYAARMFMLVCFAATAMLAYWSLCRIISNRWVALTATLLAFSSFYCLYYNDVVAPEIGIALLGVMLTFHGMVIFIQEGRFQQLLIKTCVALLLGWQVFALLLTFIVLGLTQQLLRARSLHPGPIFAALLRSHYLRLGLVALIFGTAVLAFNFTNEYRALDGKVPLAGLPSFDSLQYRTGVEKWFNVKHADALAWPPFLQEQFYRIGGMSLPYALTTYMNLPDKIMQSIGVVALGTCLLGLVFVRHKMLPATLVLSGFCWGLPMRNYTAFHDYTAVFYIGIPLVLFSLVLLYVRQVSSNRFLAGLAVGALLLFVFSSFQMGQVGLDEEAAKLQRAMMADFATIRPIVEEKSVFIPADEFDARFAGAAHAVDYYLNKSIIEYTKNRYFTKGNPLDAPERRALVDFLLLREKQEGPALLTPDNRVMFLYDRAAYDNRYTKLSNPIIEADYRVYLLNSELLYTNGEKVCGSSENADAMFFLHVFPVDPNDLPKHRRQYGFDNLDFGPIFNRFYIAGQCFVQKQLPAYPIRSIRTGQYLKEEGRIRNLWQGEFRLREEPSDSRPPSATAVVER